MTAPRASFDGGISGHDTHRGYAQMRLLQLRSAAQVCTSLKKRASMVTNVHQTDLATFELILPALQTTVDLLGCDVR